MPEGFHVVCPSATALIASRGNAPRNLRNAVSAAQRYFLANRPRSAASASGVTLSRTMSPSSWISGPPGVGLARQWPLHSTKSRTRSSQRHGSLKPMSTRNHS